MGDNLLKKSDNMGWWKGMDIACGKETIHCDTLYDVFNNLFRQALKAPALAAIPTLRHGFFGRAGGVSTGDYAGLWYGAAALSGVAVLIVLTNIALVLALTPAASEGRPARGDGLPLHRREPDRRQQLSLFYHVQEHLRVPECLGREE